MVARKERERGGASLTFLMRDKLDFRSYASFRQNNGICNNKKEVPDCSDRYKILQKDMISQINI